MNGTFGWGVVIATFSTFLSVLSILICHYACLTYFLHPKLRKINAVLTTLTLQRLRHACSAQEAFLLGTCVRCMPVGLSFVLFVTFGGAC